MFIFEYVGWCAFFSCCLSSLSLFGLPSHISRSLLPCLVGSLLFGFCSCSGMCLCICQFI